MLGLICYDCHIFRNKFASTVSAEAIDKGRKIIKIVGHRCIKCTRKKYVENMKVGVNQGWRQNFRNFVMAIQDQQKRLNDKSEIATEFKPLPPPEKKEGFGSKIKKFFNR